MKKIAKLTALILSVILMTVGLSVAAVAADSSSLTITEYDGFAAVTYCKPYASGVLDIPSSSNGLPVTQITNGAFKNCNSLTQINIPSSVTKVGSNAFDSCTSLKKIVFEGANCTIGNEAFIHCSALTEITLPSALKKIPESAFADCRSLTGIDIPDTVEVIGKEAFRICGKLTSIYIPASVKEIGKNAFLGCESVKSYSVASANPVYSSKNGVIYGPYSVTDSSKSLVQYPMGNTNASYTVEAGTLIISDYAFGGNKNIASVTLPSGLKKIDSYAFNECTSLSSINIPNSVTSIGSLAFGNCKSLKSITIPASVTNFGSAFYASGLTNVTIANGVKTIGVRSFENCVNLETISIPSSVETIGIGAFYGCTNLKSVDIPSSVTSIGNSAFGGCNSVTLTVEKDSAAHTYAVNNSISYKFKGEGTTDPTDPVKPPVTDQPKKVVTEILIETLPAKTDYRYKEALDTTGLSVRVFYADAPSEVIYSGFDVSPKALNQRGSQLITVEYGGKTDVFNVNVSFAWWQWIIWILALGFLWY